jgi:hypothetical protein
MESMIFLLPAFEEKKGGKKKLGGGFLVQVFFLTFFDLIVNFFFDKYRK